MTKLRELRDAVVATKDPAKTLILTDRYLQQIDEMGSDFALPAKHAALKPFIEMFAGDSTKWLGFVEAVRDSLVSRSPNRLAVQEFYRTLDVRITQRERRLRLNAAIAMALKKGLVPDECQAKLAYANKLTRLWLQRKETMLKSERAGETGRRLSIAVRQKLLQEFWDKIDAEIANGELPKP